MAAALLAAIVAGVAAVLIGWLTNRLPHPAWLTRNRTIALIAAAVLVGALIAVLPNVHFGDDRLQAEEKLIGQLSPGLTFARVKQLLDGQEPDRKANVRDGFIAQFEREWEFVQTVVDAGGATISIGIVAKTDKFRVDHIGGWDGPFGRTIADYEKDAPPLTGLLSFCGASRGEYMEVVDTANVPHVNDFESVAFGNMGRGAFHCADLGSPAQCVPESSASYDLAACLKATRWDDPAARRFRETTPVWAFVVTAPQKHLTPEMLQLPDELGR